MDFVIYFSYSFCKYYRYVVLLYNTIRHSSHKIFFLNEQTAFYAKLCKEKRMQLNWINLMIPYIRRWQKLYTHIVEAHLGKSNFTPCGSKHAD